MHLIIHGGPPKTGTTTIQQALWESRKALMAKGVYYHVGPAPMEWSLMMLYSHLKDDLYPVLRAKFSTVEEARDWSRACWSEFEAEVDRTQPPVTIISSEHFANIGDPAPFVKRLKKRFERIDFIAYARDPVAIYVSNVDELIRGGVRFADLPQLSHFKYDSVTNIRKFEPLLSREHIHVRNFARESLSGGDLVADFFALLSQLTQTEHRAQAQPSSTNESICGAATAWLLTMNETFVFASTDTDDREVIRERLDLIDRLRASEALQQFPRLSMSTAPMLEAVIRERARPTVKWLNAAYMDGQVPIDPGEPMAEMPSQRELRRRLRNWLLNYLTPEAVQVVTREIVPLYRL